MPQQAESSGGLGAAPLVSSGVLLAVLLGVIDYLTGSEVSLVLFYVVPCGLVTWYAGLPAGIFIAVICGAAWTGAEWRLKDVYQNAFAFPWNAASNFVLFAASAVALALLRKAMGTRKKVVMTDPVTGVASAAAFLEAAHAEIHRARRYHKSTSLAYIDVDNLKELNHKAGHGEGDRLLRVVAQTVKGTIRVVDIVARVGGDEFALLLPETGPDEAEAFVGKLHDQLAEVMKDYEWSATVSIGIASFFSPPDSVDRMVREAEELAYAAKEEGKNRIKQKVLG